MKVLIGYSDSVPLHIFQACLEARGHEVGIATDGGTFWTYLREFQPDVAVLERVLPGPPCDTILGRMQADSSLAALPTLVILGSTDPSDIEAWPSPVVALLKEPVRIHNLIRQITIASAPQPVAVPES